MNYPEKQIKSYVLRTGRRTQAQQYALDNYWADYGIDYKEELLDFTALFGNTAPVTFEIGFGNGTSLVEQAKQHPEKNYIGTEVHTPGVGHCLHRIQQEDLHNIKVMHHDATLILNHQIPEQSLHCLQLFFPDPWQKRRHHKRRILQQDFADTIHAKLDNNGLFHMATDWKHYASHMRTEMDANDKFSFESDNRGDRPLTKFETRGLKLGHDVWDFIYKKS